MAIILCLSAIGLGLGLGLSRGSGDDVRANIPSLIPSHAPLFSQNGDVNRVLAGQLLQIANTAERSTSPEIEGRTHERSIMQDIAIANNTTFLPRVNLFETLGEGIVRDFTSQHWVLMYITHDPERPFEPIFTFGMVHHYREHRFNPTGQMNYRIGGEGDLARNFEGTVGSELRNVLTNDFNDVMNSFSDYGRQAIDEAIVRPGELPGLWQNGSTPVALVPNNGALIGSHAYDRVWARSDFEIRPGLDAAFQPFYRGLWTDGVTNSLWHNLMAVASFAPPRVAAWTRSVITTLPHIRPDEWNNSSWLPATSRPVRPHLHLRVPLGVVEAQIHSSHLETHLPTITHVDNSLTVPERIWVESHLNVTDGITLRFNASPGAYFNPTFTINNHDLIAHHEPQSNTNWTTLQLLYDPEQGRWRNIEIRWRAYFTDETRRTMYLHIYELPGMWWSYFWRDYLTDLNILVHQTRAPTWNWPDVST